jgi:hypothetical protein
MEGIHFHSLEHVLQLATAPVVHKLSVLFPGSSCASSISAGSDLNSSFFHITFQLASTILARHYTIKIVTSVFAVRTTSTKYNTRPMIPNRPF